MEEYPLEEGPWRGAWKDTLLKFHSLWAWLAEVLITALCPYTLNATLPAATDDTLRSRLLVCAGVLGALVVPATIYLGSVVCFWKIKSERLTAMVREYREYPEVKGAKRLDAFSVTLLGRRVTGAEFLSSFANNRIIGGLRWEGMVRHTAGQAGLTGDPKGLDHEKRAEIDDAWVRMSQELHAVDALKMSGDQFNLSKSLFAISDRGWRIVEVLRREQPI